MWNIRIAVSCVKNSAVLGVENNVSEEHSASIFRVELQPDTTKIAQCCSLVYSRENMNT